ncbi:MAG: DUF2254 domain-containing protein [Alicyclobacillaceae bacterium]|nr:DUF2254 domain-containing protein [Alicyclobacillaceae bacterium]
MRAGDSDRSRERAAPAVFRCGIAARLRRLASSWVFHLVFAIAVILAVFLRPPMVFSGDTDTARNYLNTIVSSLSTILALCISIILVAIQLTASNYTHRVLDFFMRLPYNASLFTFYLVTIMHSFFLMAKIQDPVRDPLPRSLRPEMSADLVLVVICFISLLIYMYAVVQLLKPERIITLIVREYNRAIEKGRWRAALDNVEQICDIAKRAASVSDSVTGARCVAAMGRVARRLPLPESRDDPLLQVHQNVVDQWVEMVGVAVKERESSLLYGVLNALYRQGELYVRSATWPAAELVIKAYRHLVFSHLLCEEQVFYVRQVADKLYQLAWSGCRQGERGQLFCLRTWRIIREIGESAFATQPAGVASLLEGFLMPAELADTLAGLAPGTRLGGPGDSAVRTDAAGTDLLRAGLIAYFELWKAFAAVATMRDAARWARWWQENVTQPKVNQRGRLLAVLIAMHIQRQEIAQTLCYVWGMDLDEATSFPARAEFRHSQAVLFDGWPWRSLVSP